VLALPRIYPHLDLKKCTVGRENEEVKLIEPRDVQWATGSWQNLKASRCLPYSSQKANEYYVIKRRCTVHEAARLELNDVPRVANAPRFVPSLASIATARVFV
jgi:hypothetical protein